MTATGQTFHAGSSSESSAGRILASAVGNLVVVWCTSRFIGIEGEEFAVVGQRYGSDGVAQGSSIVVERRQGRGSRAFIAMDARGGFVIVRGDRVAQRYSASATLLGSLPLGDVEPSAVAVDADGDFVVAGQDGGDVYARQFSVSDPPTITPIAVQTTPEDTALTVPFTIGDPDTPLDDLTLSARSLDQMLVPDGNIRIGGAGRSRVLTATPVANRTGVTTITVVVSDGASLTSDYFPLTVTPVNDPPTAVNDAYSVGAGDA